MFGKVAAGVLAGVAVVALAACAASTPGPESARQPTVELGYGTQIPLANATTNAKSIPATALFASGPYDLTAKLRAYGMTEVGGDALWIDGTRQIGWDVLNTLSLDDIARVDVIRNVWGGIGGAPENVLSITTKRAQEARRK